MKNTVNDSEEHPPASDLAVTHSPPSAPPALLTNPGVPEHRERRTDVDSRAATRAERQVAGLFVLSAVGTIGFVVAYAALPPERILNLGVLSTSASNLALAGALFVSLFSLGAGAIHWAKKLMVDEEVVQERHALRSSDQERAEAVAILRAGTDDSGIARRPLIKRTLGAALAVLPVAAVPPLLGLGPAPKTSLRTTQWSKGKRLVTDPEGAPVKAADLRIGEVVHVLPEGTEQINERGKSAVLVIRLDPTDLQENADRADWSYQGIVAYSKICSHMGCPVGLYEQKTKRLLCPCHQSTFDVTRHCKVLFGPAARPLAQLAITVDSAGYLVARGDFTEPVGPSFWERG
jgi:ubiquinol-cytochrome c reductase iron-sulfur subunit